MSTASSSTSLQLTVNGSVHAIRSSPDTPLLYVLRDELQLQGPRFGCGLGQCGACTVLLGGSAVPSCAIPVSAVGDQPVTTLEGLGSPGRIHPVQQAFIEEQAVQCGYCVNGWIMTAAAFLAKTPKPSEAEIRTALAGWSAAAERTCACSEPSGAPLNHGGEGDGEHEGRDPLAT